MTWTQLAVITVVQAATFAYATMVERRRGDARVAAWRQHYRLLLGLHDHNGA